MKKRVLTTIFCLAFLALAAPAGAAETLNVGKGGPQAFQFSPLDIGMEEGIFQKHGIDVKSAQLDSAAKVHQALAAGDVDLALASGPDMAFIAKGSPARSVAAMASQPSMLSVVVAADSPITAPAGLKGKKLSVTSTGSLTYWLAHRLSLKEGWGLDGIDVVALGAQTAQLAALRTHQTDAMVMDLTAAYKFEEAHDVRIIASFGDIVPDFHMHVIHATDAIIAKNPEAVRRFLAGWFDTIAYMRTHRADTVRIVARVVNVPEHIADRAYDVVMPVMSSDGCFDPKALATLRRSYVEMGLLDKEPDMSKLYTEAYLPAPCKH